ncbi:MAG: hypothetical protein ACYSUY_17545, partial [Planctomycetota bacterium]
MAYATFILHPTDCKSVYCLTAEKAICLCIIIGDCYASPTDYYTVSSIGVGSDDRSKSQSGFC